MTDKTTTTTNNKMEETQSNRTSLTCSVSSSVTSASTANPLQELDFFALDLSDLLDSGVDAPSSGAAPASSSSSGAASPLRRSLSAPNTAAAAMRASAQRHNNDDNTPSTATPKIGPPPKGIARPLRVRRSKSNDDAPSPKPLFTSRRSRKDRSKSPCTLRLPRLTRSKTPEMGGSSRKNQDNARKNNQNQEGAAPLKRTVSFDKVQIREHEQILGDNPCTELGPSLGLGWSYHEKKELDLDKYESKRTGTTSLIMGTRRKSGVAGDVCSMSPMARTEKAIKLGYSAEEILANQKQNQKVQKRRQKTLQEEKSKDTAEWLANQQAILAPGA